MPSFDEKLDLILEKLDRIEKALDIVPDRFITVRDFESSISEYQRFAKEELSLGSETISNHKSAILGFLSHSEGTVNKDTVKEYLASNSSTSWKSNQLKALRKYTRDFLKLGNWINGFDFSKTKTKLKQVPSDQGLVLFANELPNEIKLIFLILHNSGLRIGEVLRLRVRNINFETNMIDASEIHQGDTKSSWISFVTKQTAAYLRQYISAMNLREPGFLFTVSERTVQKEFQEASEWLGLSINPHLLRTVFAEKCAKAGIADKYIDAFCGRTPQKILAKHYTDYSPTKLREIYDKAESLLILGSSA